ncbi:MAG: hypothetical protein NVS3B11_02840 [Collimonas sp.]
MTGGFWRVQFAASGAPQDLLRCNHITLTRCADLDLRVVEQQARYKCQFKTARSFKPVMAVHDGQAVPFQRNRDAPKLLAQDRIGEEQRVLGIMLFVWADLVKPDKMNGLL